MNLKPENLFGLEQKKKRGAAGIHKHLIYIYEEWFIRFGY
jgi:hypothetical protein